MNFPVDPVLDLQTESRALICLRSWFCCTALCKKVVLTFSQILSVSGTRLALRNCVVAPFQLSVRLRLVIKVVKATTLCCATFDWV